MFNRFACVWPKGYQRGSLREEPPERPLLRNKQCEKVILQQDSNLDYRSTALPLELERVSPNVLNFGNLNYSLWGVHKIPDNLHKRPHGFIGLLFVPPAPEALTETKRTILHYVLPLPTSFSD